MGSLRFAVVAVTLVGVLGPVANAVRTTASDPVRWAAEVRG